MVKIVALLTARGNNTMKDKNIRVIAGHPLLYYPATAAKNSKYIDSFYVSSDDEKILDVASACGYKRIKRPDILALPNAQHIDSILHALKYMKEQDNVVPNILVVLLGNSATIKTEWIDECIELLLSNENLSAAVPVTENSDHHPFRAKKIATNGLLDTFFDFKGKKISTNRQDLEPSYYLCHNFWVLNLKKSIYSNEEGQAPWTFMGNLVKPYIVENSFDVHDEDDIKKTEKWIKDNIDEK